MLDLAEEKTTTMSTLTTVRACKYISMCVGYVDPNCNKCRRIQSIHRIHVEVNLKRLLIYFGTCVGDLEGMQTCMLTYLCL